MEAVHLLISGKVQGVNYRYNARLMAEKLHLKGWVKNTPDEKVEAVVCGNKEDVNHFIEWCQKGPDRAVVSDVQDAKKDTAGMFDNFRIIRE